VLWAEWAQLTDDGTREELAAWTPAPGSLRRDGLPAAPSAPSYSTHPSPVETRDFDAGGGIGCLEARRRSPVFC
jgi:hypothetical protein